MKKVFVILLTIIFWYSCKKERVPLKEQWQNEIRDTEFAFSAMAQKDGIAKAFLHFADSNAVLLRNNKLIIGKKAIELDFEKKDDLLKELNLNWAPDFIDVSSSGDLGYTYGQYEVVSTDSLGNKQSETGIFHTVWKRQKDGSWKFVFD